MKAGAQTMAKMKATASHKKEGAERPASAGGDGGKRLIMDVIGTSHRPDGPWPASDHQMLAAWMKLECLEAAGKKHESGVAVVDDSVKIGTLTVVKPYLKDSVMIEVEGLDAVDLSDASEETPVLLIDEKKPLVRLFVTKVLAEHHGHWTLCTLPTEDSGGLRQSLAPVKADLMQPIEDYKPMYRRNVRNFMPSLRFQPCQYLNYVEHSYLQRKLSGPVTTSNFTLFFVAKGYNTVGSSPWPLFTAVDGHSAYSYQLHVVIEQQAGVPDSFEARWKILCGEASEKTIGIDPTQFSIVVFAKTGRLVRLFINGCDSAKAAAELIIEDESDTVANITDALFGMDANGAKYFDGELSEFLAYSGELSDAQIDSVGRYLSRKFDMRWSWNPPKDQQILKEWLENKAKGKIKKTTERDEAEDAEETERSTYKQDMVQVEATMRSFGIPEEALDCMQQLTRMARFPRKRMLIVRANPFDRLFDFMKSTQTLLKVAAIRLLTMLCKNNSEAREAVLARDGLFELLQACEPDWKQALEEVLSAKQALYDKAVVERDLVKAMLESVDKSNVATVFQARMRLKYCDSMVEEARIQVEGVYKRMTSGIEQMSNWELARTAAGAIAMIVDQDDECKELLIKMSGLNVLDRVLDTPNIPVQTSICKVITAMVAQEKVAKMLIEHGMMEKIVRLMFLDDPPVQCEAAAIILKTILHKGLRESLIKFELIPALQRMLDGPYDDNYVFCTRILHVLSTHDDAMRIRIVKNEGTIKSLVKVLQSSILDIRQRATQALAYIALTDEGSEKLWESGFKEAMLELLEDEDRVVRTHTIMAMANGSRNEAVCRLLFKLNIPKLMVEIGQQGGLGYQHLVCGVLSNMATVHDKKLIPKLFTPQVLNFLVNTLSTASLHARYVAANALRRMSWQAPNADQIVAANALPALIQIARKPRILIDAPTSTGISKDGRSLYMHWQAGRVIAALTCSPNVHLQIVQQGGLFALIQLCESGKVTLQREGASSLAFIAEIRCETECILQMAEAGAIDALQALTESPDDATGAEAMRALSSLLNFDSAWN